MRHKTSPPTSTLTLMRGFTLLEVLVALMIAAVALMACLRATGGLIDNTALLQQKAYALWSAENQLYQMRLNAVFPELGQQRHDCSQGIYQMTCIVTVSRTPHQLFRQVRIEVIATTKEINTSPYQFAQLTSFIAQPF
jgi:general secretion pathway protein I